MPVLSLGGAAIGGLFEDVSDEQGVQTMHEAFNCGINYFDTSPYYGVTRSETVMGRAIRDLPRDKIIVATKVGRYDKAKFDFSAARVTASVHESLQRLQTSYIDLIQTHDIEFGDLDQVVSETLPALVKLKQEGFVKHIGITGLPLKIYPYVLDRVPPGTVDTVLSYCHYSLNDTSLAKLVPYFKEKGVGIINASCLSMGLLTRKGPHDWHPAPQNLKDACAKAAAYADSQGVDIARLALQEAAKNADLATQLVGMTAPEQVRENVQTVLEGLGLVPNPTAHKDAEVLQEVNKILSGTQGVTWPSGNPENN
ncbi:hypothetical protein WJX72_002436 [[Myrmecia] bisecta]|uniref:NADP-dependent oxidoreductase domain-containing protein n=1 Tax=[Myrmecia] bisecta TaxID=41462 RepID=A0AAW1PTA7_9CHLO